MQNKNDFVQITQWLFHFCRLRLISSSVPFFYPPKPRVLQNFYTLTHTQPNCASACAKHPIADVPTELYIFSERITNISLLYFFS